MRKIVVQLGLVVAFLACAIPAWAGYELIEFVHPFRAHHLVGFVVDVRGTPVPGVLIEDCVQTFKEVRASDAEPPVFEERMLLDCHFEPKHVLASATTDAKGRFIFPHTKMGTTHYLYVTAHGFDPEQITVKLRRFAKRNLLIRINVAT
jgi:hypothetical protein